MNTQAIANFFYSPKDYLEYYVVINEKNQISVDYASSKILTQEQIDSAEFTSGDDDQLNYSLVEVNGQLGLYDYNLNLIESYKDMSSFLQTVFSRGFSNSVFSDKDDLVYKNFEFNYFPK